MIQHTNTRQPGAGIAQMRPPISDGPEEWGNWSGRKYYSLEIVQHPLRARMCGFGDKDRRPLAPAAVAKMIVRREDNSLVDVDDVDCSFFLVTVDLWSADGKSEMNLVLHPSSADRYIPANPAPVKPRNKRDIKPAPPRTSTGNQTPAAASTPGPAGSPSLSTPIVPGQGGASPYTPQGFPFPPSTPSSTDPSSNSYPSSSSDSSPSWAYIPGSSAVDRNTTYPPPVLPSIHSIARPPSPSNSTWNTEPGSQDPPYRPWGAAGSTSAFAANSDTSDAWSQTETPQDIGRYPNEGFQPAPHNAPFTYGPPSASQPTFYQGTPPPPTTSTIPMLSRLTYTRTLVGPLSANATRLADEHRKPGIFFLFQDLSVRTEGTFRLRLRLMNVGAPPAPEAGATEIHTGTSPVLAQSFTEPFTVYSAKRFPGVPDTTALSIALGNQGQKLPLRNRHGSSSSGKRRRRFEDDESDSDA